MIKQDSFALLKRLYREHIKPYTGRLALAMLFMVLAAGSTALLTKYLEPIINDIFVNRQLNYWLPIAVLLTFAVKGASSYGEAVTMNFVGQRIIADLQLRLFHHFSRADFGRIQRIPTGELLSRFTNDVWLLRNAVSNTLTGIGKDALTLIFLVSLMFYQDWKLASIAFFAFPTAVYPIFRIGQRLRKITTVSQQDNAAWTTMLEQGFQGARLIRAYGMEDYEVQRAQTMIDHLFRLNQKSCRIRSASHPIMEMLGGIAVVAVIVYGGLQVVAGQQTTGAFISFIGALLFAYEPLKRLAHLNSNLQEGMSAAIRLFSDLDELPKIVDQKDARVLTHVKGKISFKDVNFRYSTSEESVLDNLSFDVPPGKKIALVGPSGGGKSTILNLLPRFYDVLSGQITIDDHDIRQVTLASLRQNLALVSQEITLFDDTVAANIAYGNLAATQTQIETAAQMAAAHEFITALPQGYDTMVGEAGFKLSGGQRQRLAIARAMLRNAPILLLDEATSALDAASEELVQKALAQLMKGRTSLVIAHRLATVIDADCIFVIDRGRIVESGNHNTLMAADGLYARLAQRQEL